MQQTQIDALRSKHLALAREKLVKDGVKLDSPDGMAAWEATRQKIDNRIWDAVYQKSLQNLHKKGVGEVKFIENADDAKTLGGAFQTSNEDTESFARLQADQFLKGMKPATWEQYQEQQKRGYVMPTIESVLGGTIQAVEGMIGTVAKGGYWAWDAYGPGGMAYEPADLGRLVKHIEGGQRAEIAAKEFVRLNLGGDSYVEELAGPPEAPILKHERVGAPSGEIGGFLVGQGADVGAAIGSLPMSVPSMIAPDLATRAVAMAPFALSGYADAKQARWDIWKEQSQMAEEMGVAIPPMPTFGELETMGLIGGAFEVGSEYVGDTLQMGALRKGFGKLGIRRSATQVAAMMDELGGSLSRLRGPVKLLKGAALVGKVGVGEGLEEVVPHGGEQLQDVVSNKLFRQNDDFWKTDRAFFSSDPSGLFIDDNVWHSFKVGTISGALGGSGYAGVTAIPKAIAGRAAAKEVAKDTSFVTESLVSGQEQDAAMRFKRNAISTRGSAMALHHVEQMSANKRMAMFVDPSDRDVTLTKDVKERMAALGIATKPIGTVDGRLVYAKSGTIEEVKAEIDAGNAGKVVGTPLVNDGDVMAGAVVMRNAAGQIVEVMPYSDPAQLFSVSNGLARKASELGLKMDVVSSDSLSGYSEVESQMRRQMDADADMLGVSRKEEKAVPRRDENRGINALRKEIIVAAAGTKGKRRAKGDQPFHSKMLTKEEIGDATNDDVTVTVTLDRVSDDKLSKGERQLREVTGQPATILEPKVVFSIKSKDGSTRTIEKTTVMDGAYVAQHSPDGVFLIRENGTAFTARNAFAIAMHETRHRTLSRSRQGALFIAKLLHIDPVYAMRGGASYMSRFSDNPNVAGKSEAEVIAYYRGLHEAAKAVLAGSASETQAKTVKEAGGVGKSLSEVRRFSEESVATTANRAFGSATTMAVEWDAFHADAQERSFRGFQTWMANALVKNGFFGPEAQQALFETKQRIARVREEELQIHRQFSDRVAESVKADLEREQKKEQMRKAAIPTRPAEAPAPPPSAGSVSSMREPSGYSPMGAVGGSDETKKALADARQMISDAETDPAQAESLLSKATGIIASVIPMITGVSAQIAPSTRAAQPYRQPPSQRVIPEALRDVTPTAPVEAAPEVTQPTVDAQIRSLEESAKRQREASDAMRIISGDAPRFTVTPGTVSRIQRAQTFMQDPEEEIRMSIRERPGRREANEDVRRIRNQFMDERGIEPEAQIEETYAEVDPEFAKRVADWYESTPVNYDDPKMRAAYAQFGKETKDQYQYLVDQGYEMIPWGGKGQPYSDSADMIEDLRKNKRLYYYKTVNPDEAATFGSDPAALQEAMRKNPLLEDAGVEVLDSEGNPYQQTYNDLFRAVHDIMGHGAEGFQFGARGEENAYRSHAVMFSPLARQAMATETRGQNSWVNFGPNRRNPDGSVWGQEDPRYKPWLENLKQGVGYADQKPMLMPQELLGLYEAPQQARASLRPIESINIDEYKAGINAPKAILNRHIGKVQEMIKSLQDAEYPVGSFVVATPPSGAPISRSVDTSSALGFQMTDPGGVSIETMDTYRPEMRIANPKVGDVIGDTYKIVAIKRDQPSGESVMYSQRGKKPAKALTAEQIAANDQKKAEQAAKQAVAAQKRREAEIARKRKQESSVRREAKLAKPAISISAEVTAAPYINPNIITTTAQRDPQFSTQKAYDRINDQVAELLSNTAYKETLGKAISAATDGRVTSLGKPRRILGSFQGRVEQSMRISIPGATHEDHVLISNLLGSLLMQEASITIGEPTANTPKAEQSYAMMMYADPNISDSALRTLLAQADKQLGGASTTETGKGIFAVYTPYAGNPLTKKAFEANATAFAAANNLTVKAAPVRSTYTVTGASDVLGRKRKAPALAGRGNRGNRGLDPRWGSWIEAAAPIVEAIRDEGFDINIPGWIAQVAGADAAAVQDALINTLAERAAGGRHGLDWRFIKRASVTGQGLTDGFAIPAKTTPANAEESFAEVDALLARHPNALQDTASFERFLIDLFKSQDIPIVPADLLDGVKDNFARMAKDMDLRGNGGRLTPTMVDEAIHGLEMAQRFRALYAAGKVTPTHTVALSMWGFLSRGVSPYIQEGLFLDIVNYRSKSGRDLSYFVNKAVAGEWTKPQKGANGQVIQPDNSVQTEWKAWVSAMFSDAKYEVKRDADVDSEGDVITKNGSIGAAASHNANAFGVSFLGNIGDPVTINGKTQSGLLHFHEALANPQTTGAQVRRVFASLGGGLGIDNKVVGFNSLLAGKTDISVYDRVRVRDHYDRSGSYPNIYDGYLVGYGVYDHGDKIADFRVDSDLRDTTEEQRRELLKPIEEQAKKAAEEWSSRGPRMLDENGDPIQPSVEPMYIAGLANMFNGARGIAIYEAVERSLNPDAIFRNLVKSRPDIIPFANLGAEHWLNWVGFSGQEASHKTIDGLIQMIASGRNTITDVWAKEGRYDTFHYGGEYGYKNVNGKLTAMYRYKLNGTNWEFTPPQYNAFVKALSAFDWASLNWSKGSGTKKPKFFVSKDSVTGGDRTDPWISDPLVGAKGQEKIAELADQFGVRMSIRMEDDATALDAFSSALQKSMELNPLIGAPEGRSIEIEREFARQNIAAQTHDQAHELYLRMVAGKFAKPTLPRYTMYFDRDNVLNGIVPNDIWWHGGNKRWTVPNFDISPNQFGLHIGNFNQSSQFFDKHLTLHETGFVREPVLFPIYVRAGKVIEIADQGSWEPERILHGMRAMDYIDEDVHRDMIREMYTEIGVVRNLKNEQQVRETLLTAADGFIPLARSSRPEFSEFANQWLRNYFDTQDIDGIRYQNYIEGKTLSPFAVPSSMRKIETQAHTDYREDFIAREKKYREWLSVTPHRTPAEALAKAKEIRGDRSSLIIWRPGQVKSASADNVQYRMSMPDIRASLRFEPPAVVLSALDIFAPDPEVRMSMREGVAGRADEVTLQVIDQYDELRRYGAIAERATGTALPDIANPYLGARTLGARLGAMQMEADRQYAEILRDMTDHGISLEQMDEFLVAQHAVNGGNAYIATINPAFPDGGTGMTNAVAHGIITRAHASGRFGHMNRIAEDWRELLRAGLAMRRDAGLITNDQYNLLRNRYTHYVPLRGAPARPFDEAFEDYDSGEVFGRGMSTQGRGMPNRLGRASMAENVTSQVGFLNEDTFRRVYRNDVGQRFLRLVNLVNDPAMAEVIRPTTRAMVGGTVRAIHDANWMSNPRNFGVYINQPVTINGHDYQHGDLVVIQINNPRLAEAINTPSLPLTAFENGLRVANTAWRFVTTGMGNPFFAPFNQIKDLQAGLLNDYAAHGLRDAYQMLRRYRRAWLAVFRDAWFNPGNPQDPSYRDFINAGGDQLSWRPNDLDIKATDFDALAERVARRDPNDRGLARTLLGWYPAFFTAAETATRLANYEQRLATGSSREQAALSAREITVDFAKGGRRKGRLNTWYVFTNASIQGSVMVGRSVRNATMLAPSIAMLGMASAMIARALGGDDDETGGDKYDNIPDYVRSTNMIFMDPLGSGKYIMIPLPPGYSVFYSAGVRLADAAFGPSTAGDAVSGMVTDSLNAFNPLGGSGIRTGASSIMTALFPTAIRPLAEIGTNRNWMNRPIFPEAFGKAKTSDAYSYFDNTPEMYINAAQSLNRITGGDQFESGAIDMSPNTMQYLIGYYMSGFGRNVDRLLKVATSNDPTEVSDIPLLRGFAGNSATDTRALSERFNAIAASTMPDYYRRQAMADEATPPEVKDEIRRRGISKANIALGTKVTEADKQLKDIRKRMKAATTDQQRSNLAAARERAMKRVIREANRLTER